MLAEIIIETETGPYSGDLEVPEENTQDFINNYIKEVLKGEIIRTTSCTIYDFRR